MGILRNIKGLYTFSVNSIRRNSVVVKTGRFAIITSKSEAVCSTAYTEPTAGLCPGFFPEPSALVLINNLVACLASLEPD